ncbi:F-box/kelch-repeat protein At3g23880-like [Rhododendron vialii]|uniref:F-box/kelch-repeat protein At3g23880-like n=1 Tax=Rhododendron vialii TaxID=182163 RepID=UPI00265E177B|nr:F-box/kelch-repeat protein At3g23880-like [Rhododendron vialii]XP_058196883.1 F-box/kelch-repeat protein At3g23880-like [Rhododendron vialii]
MSDFLPEDIVVDILSRLPPKSLIRFSCVSKVWNSLITSPTFISSHLNHSLSYNNLPPLIVRQCIRTTRTEHYKLFRDTEDAFHEYQEIEFPLKSRSLHFYHLLGYVKGLFCLYEQDSHFLWNPSIRKSLTLPKPRTKVKSRYDCRLGFGFDTHAYDYKIVRIVFSENKPRRETETPLVEVYSLNAGVWKINSGASNSFPLGSSISPSRHFAACFDGAVHFAAENNSGEPFILSFDLGDEVFQTILLPKGMVNRATDINTSVFGGSLSLLCYNGFKRSSCSIWIMKDYGVVDSWYNPFKVDLNVEFLRVISLRDNGHILLEGKTPIEWELSSYDPCSQQVKNLGIQGVFPHFHVDTFEENLVLLNKKDVVSRRGVSRKRKDRSDAASLTQQEELHALRAAKAEMIRSLVEERERYIEERRRLTEETKERQRFLKEQQRQIDLCQGMVTQILQEHRGEERQRHIDLLQSMMTKLMQEHRVWESSSTEDRGPTLR